MWLIQLEGDEGSQYSVLTDKELVVGRKDADILVQSDASISRKHAVFLVTHLDANIAFPHKPPVLTLQDVSKLGSLVQGVQIKGQTKVVNSGDTITFGTMGQLKFRVVYKPLVMTTSCIAGSAKRDVRSLVLRLGGHIVSEWRKECQLLVMSNLSVTVKVICALVSQKPIVTPQYLDDFLTSVVNKTAEPHTDNYLPPLAESQLDPTKVSFKPNPARASLFQGKVFIFLSPKQFKKLSIVIELAGGTPMLMEEGTDNNEDDILVAKMTCVMSCDQNDSTQMSQNAQQWIDHVMQFLHRHGKRAITDPEIGYAMLYCSVDRYCNPNNQDISQPTNARPPLIPQSLSQAPVQPSQAPEILVPDTEMDITLPRRSQHRCRGDITHINETRMDIKIKEEPVSQVISQIQPKVATPSGKKRVREVESSLSPKSKRQAIDVPVRQTSPARNTRSRSRSPVPSPHSRSPDPSAHSRSPDPSPSRSSVNNRKSQEPISRISRAAVTKPAVMDFDDIDDLDSIPTGRRRVRKTANTEMLLEVVTEPSQVPKPAANIKQERQSFNMGVHGEQANNSDDGDIFDQIPSRKSRNKNNQAGNKKTEIISERSNDTKSRNASVKLGSKQEVNSVQEVDDFESIPSTKSRRARNQIHNTESVQVKQENIRSVKKEVLEVHDSEISSTIQQNKVQVYSRKDEPPVTEGYLSTLRPNEDGPISEYSAKVEDLPIKCVNVEEKSLLARKPGQQPQGDQLIQVDATTCIWKGNLVKNFKKFKKVGHKGCDGLPTIIGGSDLIVHEAKPREELEEWFREEMQVESQQNEIEKLAKEMFEWEPPKTRRRRP